MKPVCWRICFNESATRTVSTDVPKGNFSYNRCTIVLCERDKRDRKCELEREREKERERERGGCKNLLLVMWVRMSCYLHIVCSCLLTYLLTVGECTLHIFFRVYVLRNSVCLPFYMVCVMFLHVYVSCNSEYLPILMYYSLTCVCFNYVYFVAN